jgi:hypothetical protein
VDPLINRTARGGVDPIPLRLPPSLSFPILSLSLSRAYRSDLATAVLPHPSIQPLTPAKLVLAPPLRAVLLLHMRVKILCHVRSNINPSDEMAAEGASIPDPQAAWVWSMMTEAKIQALVDHGLLRPGGLQPGNSSRVRMSRSGSSSPPSSSAASTSLRGTSSVGCCTTTVCSWYILFPTPLPWYRHSFTSVRHI